MHTTHIEVRHDLRLERDEIGTCLFNDNWHDGPGIYLSRRDAAALIHALASAFELSVTLDPTAEEA